jgi:hypothetical protein
MSPRRHHIVSAGYQRHFADGKFIRLWHKHDMTWTMPISVRDAFVTRGFNSVYSPDPLGLEQLENQWQRIENVAIPAIEAVRLGDRSAEVVQLLKALAAIHHCRSYSHRELALATIDRKAREAPDPEALWRITQAIVRQSGRQPEPGEVERLISNQFDSIKKSNALFVRSMEGTYQKVMEVLEPLHLQVAQPSTKGFGFLFGDTPVVIKTGPRVGTRGGVGFANCEMVYLPLSRWMAISFTQDPKQHLSIAPAGIQQLNLLMRRSCIDWLAAHPAENIPRALATQPPPGWPPEDQTRD